MDTSRHIIISLLKSLQNRGLRHTIIQKVTLTLFLSLCVVAALSIGVRFVQYPYSMTFLTLIIVIGAVVSGFILSFRNRKTYSDIAKYVDEKQTLKERVSTSLELIQQNLQGELADLQILDSTEEVSKIDIKKIMPFVVPPILKWSSIPLLIIALSFAVPYQYELPKPLTIAENQAIENTINNISAKFENIKPSIREQVDKTINHLRNVKDVDSAHDQLRNLIGEVRNQKMALPDPSAIEQATQATQHFKGMDSTELVEELERLAAQDELSPELRDELNKLFAKLKKSIPQGELREELDQIQSKTVSQEKLQEIANALNQANLLNQLEAQLIESRKNIALASIDTQRPNGGLANSDGTPGEESGNKETQGSLIAGNTTDTTPTINDSTSPSDDNTTEKPLIGEPTQSIEVDGNELQLNSEVFSDNQAITRVFTGNVGKEGTEPEYLPFNDVVLNAQRNYANAIQNDNIPVRYRSQIKSYLEAIVKIDEK